MTSPEKRKLNDALLLARCVEYIDGWYGIKTEDATHRSEILPPEAQQARAEMYKVLLQKSNVTKETVAVVGFKAIMSTQYPRPEVRERIVSYVPRVTERVVINDCPIGLDEDRQSDAVKTGTMSPLDRIRQATDGDGLALFRVAVEATAAYNKDGIGVSNG